MPASPPSTAATPQTAAAPSPKPAVGRAATAMTECGAAVLNADQDQAVEDYMQQVEKAQWAAKVFEDKVNEVERELAALQERIKDGEARRAAAQRVTTAMKFPDGKLPLQPKLDPVAIRELKALQEVQDEVRLARLEAAYFKQHAEEAERRAAEWLRENAHLKAQLAAREAEVAAREAEVAEREATFYRLTIRLMGLEYAES